MNAGRAVVVWGRAAIALLALVVASVERVAFAQVDGDGVFVTEVAGQARDQAAVREILQDALARQAVVLQVVAVERIDPKALARNLRQPRFNRVLGRAFVDLTGNALATVYIVDAGWERILARHVPRGRNPEVVHEAVARIVSTAVEALRAGSFVEESQPFETFVPLVPVTPRAATSVDSADGQFGGATKATDAAAAKTAGAERASTPPAGAALRAGVGAEAGTESVWSSLTDSAFVHVSGVYDGQLLASGGIISHGPAIAAGLGFDRPGLRPLLTLSGHYRLPIEERGSPIGYRLTSGGLRMLLGGELDLAPQMVFTFGVGGGVEWVAFTPAATSDGSVWLAKEGSFAVGVGRVMAAIGRRFTSYLSARLALMADVDGSETRLLFQDSGRAETVLAWYAVRPGLSLSIAVP